VLGLESLAGNALAAATVGAVTVEALALYVGYGILSRIATPTVMAAVADE